MQVESSSATLVVDSSFIVRFLVRPAESRYGTLWREWESQGTSIHAPALLAYEVTNALWQYELAGDLSSRAVSDSVELMNALKIELVGASEIHLQALDFVRRFPERKAYDSHFLALAHMLGCDLWTSDRKLFNRVNRHLPWVQFVED